MMEQLGIKRLRPGPSGNEKAPDHANYEESKANPYPNLPDALRLNNGEPGLEVVHDVKTHNPGMDMEMASNFALLSAKYYCPHQLSKA